MRLSIWRELCTHLLLQLPSYTMSTLVFYIRPLCFTNACVFLKRFLGAGYAACNIKLGLATKNAGPFLLWLHFNGGRCLVQF